jgi:RAQPRD family integrative conjugative element protein
MCKPIISIFVTIGLALFSLNVFAVESEERIYLTQIINQLHAIKPLIVSASKEQPKTNRIQFHYTSYRDLNGKKHNGLLDDINEIENGIKEKLEKIPSAPHTFQPIKGDYINHVPKNIPQEGGNT